MPDDADAILATLGEVFRRHRERKAERDPPPVTPPTVRSILEVPPSHPPPSREGRETPQPTLTGIEALLPLTYVLARTPAITLYNVVELMAETVRGYSQRTAPGKGKPSWMPSDGELPDILNSGNHHDLRRTARYGAMAVLRLYGLSYPQIGKALARAGCRRTFHHTTVMYYTKPFLEQLAAYTPYEQLNPIPSTLCPAASRLEGILSRLTPLLPDSLGAETVRSVQEVVKREMGKDCLFLRPVQEIFSRDPTDVLAHQVASYLLATHFPAALDSMREEDVFRMRSQAEVITRYLALTPTTHPPCSTSA